MTTTYTVVLTHGTVRIDAETYRTPTAPDTDMHRELYFYGEDTDDPIATFGISTWEGVFEADNGRFTPTD